MDEIDISTGEPYKYLKQVAQAILARYPKAIGFSLKKYKKVEYMDKGKPDSVKELIEESKLFFIDPTVGNYTVLKRYGHLTIDELNRLCRANTKSDQIILLSRQPSQSVQRLLLSVSGTSKYGAISTR